MTFFFLAQALAHGHVQQMQAIGLHPMACILRRFPRMIHLVNMLGH
jgi:hypothetical protein